MGVRLQLVKSYEPGPKKRFGQHFLRDTGVIDRILRWIGPKSGDIFLDIGAGDGALSLKLAPRVARLVAIEVDSDRIPTLKSSLAPYASAVVIPADFLQLDLQLLVAESLSPGQKLRIAGNLPYNIATTIIGILLHSGLPITDMFFMVQLEVAQRITAGPGTREYGFLSVDCQHHCDVRFGFKVSPACFVPRPNVSSAMISLHPKPGHLLAAESNFEALAKAAFAYRRKKIANSLGRHTEFGPVSERLLARAGIDGSRRPEQISVSEYEHLAEVYLEDSKKRA
jgi:16S rRNA (adenine1518-N6/adenine1519-N6)-dimethyltransferase